MLLELITAEITSFAPLSILVTTDRVLLGHIVHSVATMTRVHYAAAAVLQARRVRRDVTVLERAWVWAKWNCKTYVNTKFLPNTTACICVQ